MCCCCSAITELAGIGIPLLFGRVLYRNRHAIAVDQKLQEKGEGNTPETNPFYAVRERYHKLYDAFKPEYFWWRMLLLGRKLAIASTSIMFISNPM